MLVKCSILLVLAIFSAVDALPGRDVNGRKNHHEQPTGITTYTTYPVFTVTATRSMTSTVVVPCGGVPDGHGRSDPGTGHGALHAREGGRSVKSPGEPVYYRNFTTTSTETVFLTRTLYEGPCSTQPEPTPTPTVCKDGNREELLIFDDFFPAASEEPVLTAETPFEYKLFTFDDGWQFANCGGAGFYLDQTCIPDTTLGAQLLSLHAGITSTKPTYRRITYDIGNDASGFSLDSVYVSTKPLSGGDFATIIMCGWSVEDQYVEGMPTWCEYVKLEGSTPFRRKVEVKRDNIAYIVVGAALNYAPPELDGAEGFGKGNVPVEFQLDDMAVCVPP